MHEVTWLKSIGCPLRMKREHERQNAECRLELGHSAQPTVRLELGPRNSAVSNAQVQSAIGTSQYPVIVMIWD